jgi:hypothetical protein
MDQAEPAHQAFLWNVGERGEDQIWIAVSFYVLAAIIKWALRLDLSLYTFLQILSVRPLEKIELLPAFQDLDHSSSIPISSNQYSRINRTLVMLAGHTYGR